MIPSQFIFQEFPCFAGQKYIKKQKQSLKTLYNRCTKPSWLAWVVRNAAYHAGHAQEHRDNRYKLLQRICKSRATKADKVKQIRTRYPFELVSAEFRGESVE